MEGSVPEGSSGICEALGSTISTIKLVYQLINKIWQLQMLSLFLNFLFLRISNVSIAFVLFQSFPAPNNSPMSSHSSISYPVLW